MANTPPKSSDVRQWARGKGMAVGERGRLAPEVLAAYAAAHGGATVTPASAKKAGAKKAAKKSAAKKPAKKAPAKKSAAKKSPAKKSAAKRPAAKATPAKIPSLRSAPVASRPAPTPSRTPQAAPVESSPRSFRSAEATQPATDAPKASMDGARVAALEEQISKLSARLERLEAARAAKKPGLFSRNK